MVYHSVSLGSGDERVDVYEGETALDVVTAMANFIFKDRDAAQYMHDTASRALMWNGSVVDPFTPETFLETMEKNNFITRVS